MTDGAVVLGGFVFQDHEIPNKISFGGKQQYKAHDTVGNQRVVDAMGPTPNDIAWSGRFRGAGAIQRAQTLDQMRMSGAEQQLMWLGVFYTVLVVEFEAETEKFYEVPYKIKCCVTGDPMQGVGGIFASLDSLVGSDLASAIGILS